MNLARSLMAIAVTSAISLALPHTATAQDFLSLGTGRAYGISADGRVIVGERDGLAVYWSSATGLATPFDPRSGWLGAATAASSDGRVIVGYGRQNTPQNPPSPNVRAFRWSAETGIVEIGLAGSAYSTAAAVSSDGSVVVGSSGTPMGGAAVAFRWTESGGAVALGLLAGGYSSVGTGVSGDGSIVVGWGTVDVHGSTRAFRWTASTGMVDLGTPRNTVGSTAEAISADGSTVVGNARVSGLVLRAYRWTPSGGWIELQTLAGHANSEASAVSADGSVIVGRSYSNTDFRAVRWDGTTVRTIEQWLADSGFTRPIGFALTWATGVSADGSVIVGDSVQGPWLARSGSGLLPDLEAFDTSLAEAGGGLVSAVRSQARLSMADVQARALDAWRADTGSAPCAWVSGNSGAFTDELRAEQAHVGACAQVGKVGLALGAGRSRARQDWVEGGKGRADGSFIAATVSMPLSTALQGSLSLARARLDTHLRRQYLNGDSVDVSVARPEADVESVEARVAWLSGARTWGAEWSPYVAWDWTRTEVDAYTESGGGFPAEYDALSDRSQHARLGVAVNRAWQRHALQVSIEGVHRLTAEPGNVRGRVQGLYEFVTPTDTNKGNWVQAQVGTRMRIGNSGTLAFDLHAASEGDGARWAAGVAYQVTFK
ncbi:autotransporter domain-containing protein [Pseudoxanthomonas mexicana]